MLKMSHLLKQAHREYFKSNLIPVLIEMRAILCQN